jgi:hypothetical protein
VRAVVSDGGPASSGRIEGPSLRLDSRGWRHSLRCERARTWTGRLTYEQVAELVSGFWDFEQTSYQAPGISNRRRDMTETACVSGQIIGPTQR